MLAVSAQCGCCHHSVFHFMPYLFGTFWLYYYMVILLHYNNITWICLIFFLFCITWCMCCQDYGLCYWWGVLFYCLCTTTFLCVPYGPYATYSFHFFSFLCSVYSFLYPLVPLCFLFPICVFFSCLDENFWGVWVHMYYMQPHTCVLKWVYT